MNTCLNADQWNLKDLKTMAKWYKRDREITLPTTKAALLKRYYDTHTRPALPWPILPVWVPLPSLPPLIILDSSSAIGSVNHRPARVSADDIRCEEKSDIGQEESDIILDRECCSGDYCVHGVQKYPEDVTYYFYDCQSCSHEDCGRVVNCQSICDSCWHLSLQEF